MKAVAHELKILSYFGEMSNGFWVIDDIYIVTSFNDDGATRLDIHRHDGKDGITWDVLREIKNACGFSDKDAVEFYPADDDVINCGNIRHLYVFNEKLALIRRVNKVVN